MRALRVLRCLGNGKENEVLEKIFLPVAFSYGAWVTQPLVMQATLYQAASSHPGPTAPFCPGYVRSRRCLNDSGLYSLKSQSPAEGKAGLSLHKHGRRQ